VFKYLFFIWSNLPIFLNAITNPIIKGRNKVTSRKLFGKTILINEVKKRKINKSFVFPFTNKKQSSKKANPKKGMAAIEEIG